MIKQDSYTKANESGKEAQKETMGLIDIGLPQSKNKVTFCLTCRHYYNQDSSAQLTTTAFHKSSHLLIAGFSTGLFTLHEVPDFILIHTLRYVLIKFNKWTSAQFLMHLSCY